MTVVMLKETSEQTDLFGELLAAYRGHMQSGEALIAAYIKCVEAGMDVSPETLAQHGFNEDICCTLARIAEGKLLPEVGARLLFKPPTMAKAVAEVGHAAQRKLLEGVPVKRDGAVKVLPVEELLSHEVKRLFDPTTKRLLTPEEQEERMKPRQARNDQRITLCLQPDDYNAMATAAKRAGHAPTHQGVAAYILTVLARAGALKGRSRTK